MDRCSMCEYFDWDIYCGEVTEYDMYPVFYCKKGNRRHVDVNAGPCERYVRAEGITDISYRVGKET